MTPHMYTIMAVPRSGLFYVNGKFVDGNHAEVPWGRSIGLWHSRMAAVTARGKLRERYPQFEGKDAMGEMSA